MFSAFTAEKYSLNKEYQFSEAKQEKYELTEHL